MGQVSTTAVISAVPGALLDFEKNEYT